MSRPANRPKKLGLKSLYAAQRYFAVGRTGHARTKVLIAANDQIKTYQHIWEAGWIASEEFYASSTKALHDALMLVYRDEPSFSLLQPAARAAVMDALRGVRGRG